MLENFWLTHSGYYRVFRNILIAGGGFERVRMPFLFGIALHPDHGPVLLDAPFDEGGPVNMGALAATFLSATGLSFEPEWSVPGRLEELGFAPDDVEHVLVTHLHGDHTGAMKLLGSATFHIAQAEWEHANDVSFVDRTIGEYVVDDYAELGGQMEFFDDLPHLDDGEGLDLFGDGSVEVFTLPGHTPGHCVYRFHVRGGDTIFYAADAAHTLVQASGEADPGLMPRQFTHDMKKANEGLASIRRHLDTHPDDELIVCHDPELGARVIDEGPMVFGERR